MRDVSRAPTVLARAHWGIDVLSGFAWGGFWLATTVIALNGPWCAAERRPIREEGPAPEASGVPAK